MSSRGRRSAQLSNVFPLISKHDSRPAECQDCPCQSAVLNSLLHADYTRKSATTAKGTTTNDRITTPTDHSHRPA